MDLLALHDWESRSGGDRQYTLGGVWRGEKGPASFRVQALSQFGRRDGFDVRAYLFAARAGLEVLEEKGSVTLWYDHLSGGEDVGNDRVEVFSTLYGSRNKFYGRADYFTDIPLHTGGLGLRDMVLKLAYAPTEILSLNLDLHALRTAERGDLSSQRLGEEADAWLRYQFREHLAVQAGFSVTWGGPAMEELGRLDGVGKFAYCMTSLRF
jgi:hypothetical protein